MPCTSCRRWFDKKEDDGLIRRRLKLMDKNSSITNYRVTVYTSDLKGAGTDASVYIELFGILDGKETQVPGRPLFHFTCFGCTDF